MQVARLVFIHIYTFPRGAGDEEKGGWVDGDGWGRGVLNGFRPKNSEVI